MTRKTKIVKSKKEPEDRKGSTKVPKTDPLKSSKKRSTASKSANRATVESEVELKTEFTEVPYQGIALIPLVKPAAAAPLAPEFRGKQGKLALTVNLALDAVAATDYVLRKYTKAGGIEERLRRLGQKSEAFFSKRSKK